MTANQINFVRHKEDVRSHGVDEAERQRHNLASEKLGYYQAGAGYAQAAASRYNTDMMKGYYDAMAQARGSEVASQNQFRERQARIMMRDAITNFANAMQNYLRAGATVQQAREQARHNLVMEGYTAAQIDEAERHNRADESVRSSRAFAQNIRDLTESARGIVDLLTGGGI